MKDESSKAAMVAALILTMAGCGGGGGNPPDGGGGTNDGGTRDSGADAGATGCTIDVLVANFGTLSPQCFTRCTSATFDAVNACADVNCVNSALQSDPTPGIPWSANGEMQATLLTCINCYGFQNLHCFSTNGCATEVNDLSTCMHSAPMANCDTELSALDSCVHSPAHSAAVAACVNDGTMGARACFPQ